MRLRPLLLLALIVAAGCRNSCQQMCKDMANFAKDNCGLEFSSDQISQCIQDHAKEDGDARAACRTADPTLSVPVDTVDTAGHSEWTCDNVKEYFD